MRRDPIAPSARRYVIVVSSLVLGAALVAAAVRLLPWILDPTISWTTLSPFVKSLLAVAFEGAVLTGWAVGWALAAQRLVERGEARVLAALGERPERTVLRLGRHGAVLAVLVALTSLAFGREAAAPGRVVNELLAQGRGSCARAESATQGVPFVQATWLCAYGDARLVGRAPIGNVIFSASGARVSDDLRRIDLDDARLALAASGTDVRVHVASLTLGGLAPWARASSLPPLVRALVVTISGLSGASAVVYAMIRWRRRLGRAGRVAAATIGAAGPLAALATLRALELRVPEVAPGAWLLLFALVPLAAPIAVAAAAVVVTLLPGTRRAGST